MKFCLLLLMLAVFQEGRSERVCMDVNVHDTEGRPVKGAAVRLSTNDRQTMPYQKPSRQKLSGTTDSEGRMTKRFHCWDGHVNCYVSADGYYQERIIDIFFKSSFNRDTSTTDFLEDHKTIEVCLKPKINPIGLYAYRPDYRCWNLGDETSCCGYDLRLGDWLPPRGKGETADFYVHHSATVSNGVHISKARITFGQGGGAYVVKGAGALRPIVYRADTNCVFQASFETTTSRRESDKWPVSGAFLSQYDALVIRSRVVVDSHGKIVSANYSKIYGPFSVNEIFSFGQTCFNPTKNDTNLEFDTRRNLSGNTVGIYYP